jgi:hypothetical protein
MLLIGDPPVAVSLSSGHAAKEIIEQVLVVCLMCLNLIKARMASGNEKSRCPDPTFTIQTDDPANELNICTEANNDFPQSLNWNNHEMKVIRGNQPLGVPRQIVYEPDLLLIIANPEPLSSER